ncbi:hypothetical protein TGPRC2_425780, partial [Toxoplasma gondii TgCatPRC2]
MMERHGKRMIKRKHGTRCLATSWPNRVVTFACVFVANLGSLSDPRIQSRSEFSSQAAATSLPHRTWRHIRGNRLCSAGTGALRQTTSRSAAEARRSHGASRVQRPEGRRDPCRAKKREDAKRKIGIGVKKRNASWEAWIRDSRQLGGRMKQFSISSTSNKNLLSSTLPRTHCGVRSKSGKRCDSV